MYFYKTMKVTLTLIFTLLFVLTTSGQTQRDIFLYEITYHLNEDGSALSPEEFQRILRENPEEYHRWDQIENDSIRISRLIPKKEEIQVSYPDLFQAVEKSTNSTLPGNPVIIIFYNYFNDFCSPASSFNEWGTLRIRGDKRFSDNVKRRIQQQYSNVIAYHFFEPGIDIEPSQVLKEHFFIDENQFLRKSLFKTQSSCGSIAIIKPGGKTIIHNGETSVSLLAASLND